MDEQGARAPVEAEAPAGTTPPPLASWLARAGAIIIDSLLMSIPLAAAIACFVIADLREDEGDPAGPFWVIGVLSIVAYVVVPFLYFSILNGNERGQTLGKRVTGIRVRRMDGSALGIGRALGRYAFVYFLGWVWFLVLPIIVSLLDIFWPLWDNRNQALHDKIVDSVVVRA